MTRQVHILMPKDKDAFNREIRTLRAVAELHRDEGLYGVLAEEACNWPTVEEYCRSNDLDYSLITAGESRLEQFDIYNRKWRGAQRVRLAYVTGTSTAQDVEDFKERLASRSFGCDVRSI